MSLYIIPELIACNLVYIAFSVSVCLCLRNGKLRDSVKYIILGWGAVCVPTTLSCYLAEVRTLTVPLFSCILIVILIAEHRKSRIIFLVIMISAMGIAEFLAELFWKTYGTVFNVSLEYHFVRFVNNFFDAAVVLIAGVLIKKLVMKRLAGYTSDFYIGVFLFPVLLCWLVYNIAMWTALDYTYWIVVLILLFVIMNTFSVILIIKLEHQNSIEKNRFTAISQLRIQSKDYFDDIKTAVEKTRKRNHDFNNIINTCQALIEKAASDAGGTFLREVKEKYTTPDLPYYCDNHIANAIFSAKESKAKNEGIAFEVRAVLEENLPFEQVDICVLLANVLDNAIDGAKASGAGEPFIQLDVWSDNGKYHIKCVNSCLHRNLRKRGQLFLTTKDAESEHGLGLYIIRETAEKYGGEVICRTDDGMFRIAVVLECDNEVLK